MSTTTAAARQRVETGIWKRRDQHGRVRFEIAYRDSDGRQRRRTVEGGLTAAHSALHKIKGDLGSGIRIEEPNRAPTFDAAADEWFSAREHKFRPATRSAYTYALKHLRREFGDRRLDKITSASVGAYVAREQRAGLRGWTLSGHLVVANQVISYAQRRLGYTGANPIALLERGERPSTDDEREKRILAPDELRRLLDAIPQRHRLLFEVIAESGMRKGEALGLGWGDINLEDATISLTHQLDSRGRRAPLKTKRSRRTLEITPALASKLKAHKLAAYDCGDHNLVFVTSNGRAYERRNVLRILDAASKYTGLGEVKDNAGTTIIPKPTVHCLRHTHGSALIAAGWDIEEVSARLGHRDSVITLRTYTHAYDQARRSTGRRDRLTALYDAPGETEIANLNDARKAS
jgi:integrase